MFKKNHNHIFYYQFFLGLLLLSSAVSAEDAAKTQVIVAAVEGQSESSGKISNKADTSRYDGPGDSKEGYDSSDYKTSSTSLLNRVGKKADLMKWFKKPPLGLPKIPVPEDNPITLEKVELGRKLFFDRRLSLNNTISCAMCHIPEQGFTSHELKTSVGLEGRSVRRNAPTIYNVAYLTSLFHDGRETSLENQVWQPILARNEMAMPSIGVTIDRLRNFPDYKGLFEKAFNGEKADIVNIGQALASYQRALVSAASPFDKWYFAKDKNAISKQAQRGFDIFMGKGQCSVCHTVNEDYALFTDNKMHNTGMGFNKSMRKEPEEEKVQLAPGIFAYVKRTTIKSVGLQPRGDVGMYEVTEDPADRWRYRTPSLRNLTLTAPYMHNGEFETLKEVVEFYNHGGFKNITQSPLMKPLNLSQAEIDDLLSFLKTLTGDNVKELVLDSFAAPVGDTVTIE